MKRESVKDQEKNHGSLMQWHNKKSLTEVMENIKIYEEA